MKTFWIVALLVASCGVYARGQADDEYDNYFNYDNLEELDKMIDEEINESSNRKTEIDNDLKVEEEIQQFREAGGEKFDAVDDPQDTVDNMKDYQFEDNRDKFKEDRIGEKKDLPADSDGSLDNPMDEAIDKNVENRPEPDDPNAPSRNEDYALLWGDDNVAPLPVPETDEEGENKAIIEETKQILAEKDSGSFGNSKEEALDDNKAIIEETEQILAEKDSNSFEEDIKSLLEKMNVNPDETIKEETNDAIIEETKQILAEKDADNFEEEIKKEIEKTSVMTDKLPNMEQILDETKQLLEESVGSFNDDTNIEDIAVQTEVDEKEKAEKENVENKVEQETDEDTVDKVYEDLNADLEKLFATIDKLKNDISGTNDDGDDEEITKALEEADKIFADLDNRDVDGSEDLVHKYEDLDFEKLLENILAENDRVDDTAAEVLEPLLNDALNEPNPDDAAEKDVESFDLKLSSVLYMNDALVDEPKENAETVENSGENNASEEKDASVEEETVKSILVDELASSELRDLVNQFRILYGDETDVHSDSFDRDVAPVHMTLKVNEPTVITSPGYPGLYPTNNTVDWILEGPGTGIELNLTNFAVNGALGDYLIIKPGGIDSYSHEGLVFTYRLSSVRRYRFTDTDRLFMRFRSEVGPEKFNGFSLSVKMMAPIPDEPEPIPEPEAVLAPPHSTATVTLALPVREFDEVKKYFTEILADMASEYIKDNDVELGMNSTSEVTQITSVSLCPMTWPDYEGCTAVTFGVSLVYEDEDADPRLDEDDLKDMWVTYVNRDPFALRLRTLGITEFYGPKSAMTAWLVIAGGVVISMSMLAFVLWRYNVGGYTRMKMDSDTDSLHNDKRKLDLYPTPHQTLPPLYAETQEYKWAEEDTRVDMGGFANRSYTRENMYDFDSDEDVIPTRDRQGAVTAKDSNV